MTDSSTKKTTLLLLVVEKSEESTMNETVRRMQLRTLLVLPDEGPFGRKFVFNALDTFSSLRSVCVGHVPYSVLVRG